MRCLLAIAPVLAACSVDPASSNVTNAAVLPPAANRAAGPVLNNSTSNATANATQQAAPLRGTRAEQVARLLVNVANLPDSPGWEAVRANFPGARWETRQMRPPGPGDGSTHDQTGRISLAGTRYEVYLSGTAGQVRRVELNATGGDIGEDNFADQDELRRAIEAAGVRWAREYCVGYALQHIRLTGAGGSKVFDLGINYGSRVASTDYYHFDLAEEFQRPTDEESPSCAEQ